ncbi:MAG: phospholipase D-like domain-containing protein [Candidatus Eisenbacteria bacterium]
MRRFVASLLLVAALAAAVHAAPAPAARGAAPALELGESRPAGTTLGNPALPEARAVWLEMIGSARHTLDLEHFYFSHHPGESLQPVVDAIGAAAARGVKVRLLLDANMSKTYPQPADSIGALPNVTLRRVDYRRLAGGVQHAKFMIVDGRDAWLGSQNLDWRALSEIHELGVRMRDPRLAAAATAVFDADWLGADTTQAFTPGASSAAKWPLAVKQPYGTVQAWFGASPEKTNPAGIPWDRALILERIHGARREICIQLLQYGVRSHGYADSTIHRALIAAGERGVQVKLLVSDWALGGANEPVLRELSTHPNIEVRISRVPFEGDKYIPFARVEHCKYMVADGDWLWVGTSNWEPSYFMGTRNVGLTVHDRVLAGQARTVFETSWTAPSALKFSKDAKLEPREHGMQAPAGMTLYGE